jgi:integrase
MDGHIRKRGNRWYVILELPKGSDGKRRQKWVSAGDRKEDARRLRSKLVTEIHEGRYLEPTDTTLADYLDKWMSTCETTLGSRKTAERYRDICEKNIAPKLGHIPLSKLTPLDIQGFYAWELSSGRKNGKGGLSAQTVLHHHRVLKRALSQAVKWRLVVSNPADGVDAPRPEQREMNALDGKGIEDLLRALEGDRLYFPTQLAFTTGLRRSEILGLKWTDIDLSKADLSVRRSLEQTRGGLRFKEPKTKKSARTVALAPVTVKALGAHRAEQARVKLLAGEAYEDNGLVFPDPLGAAWKPDSFSSSFAAKMRKLGFTITFHDTRHSHATVLLAEGVHPKIVSERLGHSTIGMTLDRYSHVLPNMQEAAAQATEAALGG